MRLLPSLTSANWMQASVKNHTCVIESYTWCGGLPVESSCETCAPKHCMGEQMTTILACELCGCKESLCF